MLKGQNPDHINKQTGCDIWDKNLKK